MEPIIRFPQIAGGILIFILLGVLPVWAEELEIRWQAVTGGAIVGPILKAVGEGTYVVSEDRYLYLFDDSGERLHRTYLYRKPAGFQEIGPDGKVYVVLREGRLVAVNRIGRIVWHYTSGARIIGNPQVWPDGTVIIADAAGRLHAISHTGRLRWKAQVPGGISSPPVEGAFFTMYVPRENGTVAVYSYTGILRKSIPVPGVPIGMYPLREGGFLILNRDGYVSLLDRQNVLAWTQFMGAGAHMPIQIGPETFGIASYGKFTWFNASRGEEIDLFYLPLIPNSSGAVSRRGRIYLSSATNDLIAITLQGEHGGPRYEIAYRFSKKPRSLLLTSRGELYTGGEDWILYCFAGSGYGVKREKRDTVTGYKAREKYFDMLYDGNFDYLYLKHLVTSQDKEKHEIALSELQKVFTEQNQYHREPYALFFLTKLSLQGVLEPIMRDTRVVNNFPVIRGKAIKLLGEVGTLDTRAIISQYLLHEYVDSGIIAGIIAIGRLGGGGGQLFSALLQKYDKHDILREIADAIVTSMEATQSYRGILLPEEQELLLKIFQGDFGKEIRFRALQVLRKK